MKHKFKYGDRVIINDDFYPEQFRFGIVTDYYNTGLMDPDADKTLYEYTILLDTGQQRIVLETKLKHANCES